MYFTYRDAIDHLLDVQNLDGKDVNDVSRKVRRAVIESINDLPASHDWFYLIRTGMVTTTVPYQTGTIAYNATTKEMTLTGGTWPAEAEFGSILVNKSRFDVLRRVSNTVIEMDPLMAPPADIAAGTAYQWIRQRYLLPLDVADIRDMTDTRLLTPIVRTSVEDNFWRSEAWYTNGSPASYCLVQSKRRPGHWELWLSAAPVDVRQYRYLYQYRFASTQVEELSTGTVAISGDQATFSTSVLTDNHVGCVLRISANGTDIPTNLIGRYSFTDRSQVVNILNPAETERIITKVVNGTTAVLNQSASTVSGRKYTISSMIDLNFEGLQQFFHRLCEYKYNLISRADSKIVGQSYELMIQHQRIAMAADGRRLQQTYNRPYVPRPIINE